MKKGAFIVLAAIVLLLVVCETGVEINLNTIKLATTNIVKFESGLLGNKSTGLLTITWRWAIAKPEVGDGIIVQRSTDNNSYFDVETLKVIDTAMTYKTSDSLYVRGGTKLFYKLNYLNGQNIEPFDTIEVNLLPYISFKAINNDTLLKDTLSFNNDTLTVTCRTIKNRKGELLTGYKVEVYKGKVSTNIDSVLNLVNPLDSKEITTGASDSVFTCTFAADTIKYTKRSIYTIKVAPKLPVIEVIAGKALTLTDNSLGFRAFFRY